MSGPDGFDQDPILVEVVRNGLVESVHRARVVLTRPDGSIGAAIGAVNALMYPRSANKPMQAVGMLRGGLDLDGELLALAASSHSGEPFHIEGVRKILGEIGLGEELLQNTADYPLDDPARVGWIAAGHGPEPIAMNCSGKHAAMIRTCVRSGLPIENYRSPEHPLQRRITASTGDLAGETVGHIGVDGCGAPVSAISLAGLARAYGRLASATGGPMRQVAQAYREHPEWASGTQRDEAALHRAIPGLICKSGAEAVEAIGLPDGRGIALKIDDGNQRAKTVLAAQVLRRLGYDDPIVHAQAAAPVLGHGEPSGLIRVRPRELEAIANVDS